MLADSRALQQSLRFMDGWLDLDRLENLRPDPRRFPLWNALDLYNTLLEAHGIRRRLGPVEREFRRLDGIRA